MNLLEAIQTNDAVTINGAVTHSTSMNSCVDLFFIAGASRNMNERDIINLFVKAYAENPEIALKILFWARDCRGGAGERRFFIILFEYWLTSYFRFHKKAGNALINLIPEYGYWKDLVTLDLTTPFINALIVDRNGLAAKWTPRKGEFAELLRKELKLNPKAYRQLLVSLSSTVEQKMCARQWDTINYKTVPSNAFQNYKKAFERHDPSRFTTFIADVEEGKTSVNSGQLFPYQLYQSYSKRDRFDVINQQWAALPDYLTNHDVRMIPVCDVSGSMTMTYGNSQIRPIDISVSLGVYLSERNKGIFKDAFITFSSNPTLQILKGTACERFAQLERAQWNSSTNIQGVFALLLATGLENNIPEHEMPNCVLIISDMEFNSCGTNTNYDRVKEMYTKYGYKIPQLVFWNVNGRATNVPVKAYQKDTALVSGASPAIVKSVLSGEDMTPVRVMLNTVLNERYTPVTLNY